MNYCTECGEPLPNNIKFCPSCGTPVVKTNKSKNPPKKETPANTGGTLLSTDNLYGRTDPEKLPEGYLIDSRYKIIRKLGQGSFGAVYLVYDRTMEMQKALKIIPEVISNDKKAMLSLRKEAAVMAKLNHKNIVRVYDFHHTGEMKYIDMEYVDGKSLADLLLEKPDKKFTEAEVKAYALQIAEGLRYAHNQKVIHKDIKPQNIMLTKNGIVKLMDFGIAETVHSSMSRLKNTGTSGTLVYMSPEQLRGRDVGKEADIYSLGATLYELLNGNPPFYRGDIYSQILNEKPAPLTGVSQQMNTLVMKCLEKERKDRFTDSAALIHALQNGKMPAAAQEQAKEQKVKITSEKTESQKRKNSVLKLSTLVLIIVALLVTVLITIIKQKETAKKTEYPNTNNSSTFTDPRDGQTYKTVTIGAQIWMAENLKYLPSVSHYSDGSNIQPYYYVYDYQGTNVSEAKATTNYKTYGVLYNWPAAMKACPKGWHLPTDEEWKILTDYLGGDNVAGGKLKETGTLHWDSPNIGATNSSSFLALPGGCRDSSGYFSDLGGSGYWWSATANSSTYAWTRDVYYYYDEVYRSHYYKEYGFSVRCVQN